MTKPHENLIEKLASDHYTTFQVARAIGRTAEHWCRIRHRYIVKYNLKVVQIGRKYWYQKEPVDKMIEKILTDGD